MKLMKLCLSLFIVCSLLDGCISKIEEKTLYSDELIYAKIGEIDLVQIDHNKQDSIELQNNKIIGELVEKLKGIKLIKLSVEEELALFEEKETLYIISLSADQDGLVGSAFIFTTGEIDFPDVKTMHTEERTVSYINEKGMGKKFDSIV